MTLHTLRIDSQPLADLLSGAKTCEVRKDDRDFEVGDSVSLLGGPTLTITHIQRGYGLPDDLCVLSYGRSIQLPRRKVKTEYSTAEEDARADAWNEALDAVEAMNR